jgi:hypothetical protein
VHILLGGQAARGPAADQPALQAESGRQQQRISSTLRNSKSSAGFFWINAMPAS